MTQSSQPTRSRGEQGRLHSAIRGGRSHKSPYRAGDWKAAPVSLGKAAELEDGGMGMDLFLAMAHWQSGKKDLAVECYERGVRWMERYVPLDENLCRFRPEAAALMGLAQPATTEEAQVKPKS